MDHWQLVWNSAVRKVGTKAFWIINFYFRRQPTSFQRGICNTFSVIISIAQNFSTILMNHDYRSNGYLRKYEQNATYLNTKYKSVWTVKYNGSFNSECFHFYPNRKIGMICLMAKFNFQITYYKWKFCSSRSNNNSIFR
jgi:hypothetical protein